ncbi:aminoglycoside phosphotransferase family protein [Streptomyces sp. WAC 00631]|uniref:aminoglycoside phosphotransferase family protein n=1 Tax=Streptomyces sp. WAC 00631 TaxID=2203201 RepID=UPI000F7858F5|nr:aminoglycoside phosphotransferase family protein [Streptomyces sp. WAC 00631]MCC5033390.1 aminoglycoside phosphotransferase family protein [Streptomyces sp. WAC 00631]
MTDGRISEGGPAPVEVPEALAAAHVRYEGEAGRAWVAALPGLAESYLGRWRLRRDGPVAHGVAALVVPVVGADGTPAVLKLQPVTDETAGEPDALRAWDGDGAVRLLRSDPETGTMLLERLDPARTLAGVGDDMAALRVLAELLARLTAHPAPPGVRRLGDAADGMLRRLPAVLPALADPAERRLLDACGGAVRELAGEPGDRLLHWDLHYENVLAPLPGSGRGPWLAIDPKPLTGDPGFELLPALRNRWDDVTATGDVPRAVRRRFDLMTEILGLDRARARGWTLGRVLQTCLWETESGATVLDPAQRAIAEALSPAG